MSNDDSKSDTDPRRFFEGMRQELPPPKTKEEAGQYVVNMYRDELDKITDPKQRERAESDLRSHGAKTFGTTGQLVENARAFQARWEQKINSMSDRNPLKAAAVPVFRAVQNQQHEKIGRTVRKDAQKDAAIMASAREVAEKLRQRQAQSSRGKEIDRER